MIHTAQFVESLRQHNIRFFAGVPDSLLKNFCAYLTATLLPKEHIIAANEGGAVGMSIGYHLATGNIGCVYMQNSGEGNIINPLLSLADEKIYEAACGENLKAALEEAICKASMLTSLRIGDYVAIELTASQPLCTKEAGDTHIKARFCENETISVNIIF